MFEKKVGVVIVLLHIPLCNPTCFERRFQLRYVSVHNELYKNSNITHCSNHVVDPSRYI